MRWFPLWLKSIYLINNLYAKNIELASFMSSYEVIASMDRTLGSSKLAICKLSAF